MQKLLRPGGRTGFFTIVPTDGLSPTEYQKAIRFGPGAVSTRRRSHEDILRTAGFVGIRSFNVTRQWRHTVSRLIVEQDSRSERLIDLIGRDEFTQRQRMLRRSLQAVDRHLLERRLYIAQTA
jgi:hypothetical protein